MSRCAYAIDLSIAMPIKIREELVKLVVLMAIAADSLLRLFCKTLLVKCYAKLELRLGVYGDGDRA
jgi:hypothetical protein